MLLHIREVLTAAQVAQCKTALNDVEWVDGRATAGHLSAAVKRNQQIREDHPVAHRLGKMILDALERNPVFVSGSLPCKIVPPLFNRYANGQSYGRHIDGGVRPIAGTSHRVRTDLAATLFLSSPDEYEGGELVIEDTFANVPVKLPAGDLVLYPASSLHQVLPVERGVRLAAFFWIQSLVREDVRRRMLYELDLTIQALSAERHGDASVLNLTGLYHNLLREWTEIG